MVVLAGLVALVAALMILWWVVSVILRSPSLMRRFYRNRRRDRGYYALSQGLVAASSGDAGKARKLSKDSRNLLGDEPLVQLLDAQTLLLEGNRQAARERFGGMLDDDDTRLVGLRGLYLEAEREGEKEASLHYAQEAAKLSPSLPWAGNALLRYQSATGDFEAALRTLETNRAAGLVGKAEADRKRAVLLTAQAIAEEAAAPDKAIKHATQALKLAPSLVPAAVTAATAYARKAIIAAPARRWKASGAGTRIPTLRRPMFRCARAIRCSTGWAARGGLPPCSPVTAKAPSPSQKRPSRPRTGMRRARR